MAEPIPKVEPVPSRPKFGLRDLFRLVVWGVSAASALFIALYAATTETGRDRLFVAIGEIHEVLMPTGVKPIRPLDAREGRRLAETVRSLAADRDRLLARVASLEQSLDGVTGSIGSALSFALAARQIEPRAPVIAVLGDGTIGFHIAEFETAVRRGLPFVAVLGNDARWNAESEIQRRDYGANRMHGCELLPARYDQVVAAFGGHGEYVERAGDLPGAIERALASGKPSCINVMIESIAAPTIRLSP